MKSINYQFLILISIISIGCSEDEIPDKHIEVEFQEYVDRFEAEAITRGFSVDISSLSVVFSDTLKSNCGYGSWWNGYPSVNINAICWQSYNDIEKEILMFHELGHAVLERLHIDERFPNGSRQSMMHTDIIGVYNEFTLETREYYLDELFDQSISAPDWAKEKVNFREIEINSSLDDELGEWAFFNINDELNENKRMGDWTQEEAVSPNYSLKISSENNINQGGYSYWRLNVTPPEINTGSSLILKVKIKLDNVQGRGVYLSLRGDNNDLTDIPFFTTTQGETPIIGTHDFVEYNIGIGYYPEGVDLIKIFLMMGSSTTGTVYFDDITLEENF